MDRRLRLDPGVLDPELDECPRSIRLSTPTGAGEYRVIGRKGAYEYLEMRGEKKTNRLVVMTHLPAAGAAAAAVAAAV